MTPDPGNNGWSLEVVRGRDVGKLYALTKGEVVLGNAPDGSALDLSDQEGASPRRMAARQAQLECSSKGLTLRDLDSPGGTFVNRQRVLPGQSRTLRPGDLIQLGGVQLKVVAGGPPRPASPAPKPAATPPPASKPKEKAPAAPARAPRPLRSPAPCRLRSRWPRGRRAGLGTTS